MKGMTYTEFVALMAALHMLANAEDSVRRCDGWTPAVTTLAHAQAYLRASREAFVYASEAR